MASFHIGNLHSTHFCVVPLNPPRLQSRHKRSAGAAREFVTDGNLSCQRRYFIVFFFIIFLPFLILRYTRDSACHNNDNPGYFIRRFRYNVILLCPPESRTTRGFSLFCRIFRKRIFII